MTEKVFLVMFDAKMRSSADRSNYRAFLAALKREGFSQLQKSVYIRMFVGGRSLSSESTRISRFTPCTVSVRILELSVGTFDAMCNINCEPLKFVPLGKVICI